MTLKDTKLRYGYISMANHWLGAGLMIVLLLLGWFMEDIGGKATEIQLTELHVSIGMGILFLTLLRILWRKTSTTPPDPEQMLDWQKKSAKAVKLGLYITMIGLSITGWALSNADGHIVSVFGLFDMPSIAARNNGLEDILEEVHEILVTVFLIFVSAHILATLKHHLWDQDDVLSRMLPEK